jgi:DNA-binding HxlR family transcriptional regulator
VARTYDDPCGLARALNLVGERWAMLVVRELLLGPKRFSDLRRGLPGASQSMLSSRLTELEAAGVLRRRHLGPPVGSAVYELTPWGRELEPALLRLAGWGSRAPLTSSGELSVDALALALRTTFDAGAAAGLDVRCQLLVDGDTLIVTVRDGRLDINRGHTDDADLVIEAGAAGFRALTFGGATPDEAGAVVRGDPDLATRVLRLFPRPAPVDRRS